MTSIILNVLIFIIPCGSVVSLEGQYLGQEPPGLQPELFAPDIFSKTHPEWVFCTEFSPDGNELFFSENDVAKNLDRIMIMKQENGIWTKPEVAPFSGNFNDNDQRLAPDGNTIFWRSWRPLPGNDIPEEGSVIWFARRTENGWSEAKPVQYGSNYLRAGYPSITMDSTLYFSARMDANIGESDIHCSAFNYGSCEEPRNLGASINTKYTEGDLYVAPDESFLIVSCWGRPDNNGDSDLYISYLDSTGTWTALKNMGEPINTKNNENCPSFSPDGKYFFYMSADLSEEPFRTNTYWVDAEIIKSYY